VLPHGGDWPPDDDPPERYDRVGTASAHRAGDSERLALYDNECGGGHRHRGDRRLRRGRHHPRATRFRRIVDPLLAAYYAVPTFIFYPMLVAILGLIARR